MRYFRIWEHRFTIVSQKKWIHWLSWISYIGICYMSFRLLYHFSLFSSSTIPHFAQHANMDGQCLGFSSFMFLYLDYIPMKIHYLLFLFTRSSGDFAINRLSNEFFFSRFVCPPGAFLKFACLFFRWFYCEFFFSFSVWHLGIILMVSILNLLFGMLDVLLMI